MLHRRLEEVALNAWPAFQHMLFDGWIVRFSAGYTKRANSVTPLFASRIDVTQKVMCCERLYQEKGLPCIFRLPSFTSAELDQVLAGRNYTVVDPTLVLHRTLNHVALQPDLMNGLQFHQLDTWIDIFGQLSDSPVEQQEAHKAILQAIPAKRVLVSLANGESIVACGMGVLEQDYFGLFDLVTAPHQRNKGYGTKLVAAMVQWAAEQHATDAYLQVVEKNIPARRLYTRLSFQAAYRYWYCVAPA